MKPMPEPYQELTQLISGLLDGRLSMEERARLGLLLEQDAEARRIYMTMVDQEIELSCLFTAGPAETPVDLASYTQRSTRAQSNSRRRQFAIAIAALLLLSAAIVALLNSQFRRAQDQKALTLGRSASNPSRADSPPDAWSESFEDGLARGWTGQVTATGLPPGSKFGISSIRVPYRDADYYAIRTPEDWEWGLFTVTSNSTLHLTYRVGTPTWVNLFIHTIPAGPSGDYAMYHLPQTQFPGRAANWQTASIPLAQFIRKIHVQPENRLQFAGGPPQSGEIIAVLIFSSPDPIDLVIDKIWVTPDGSGREEIRPLGN